MNSKIYLPIKNIRNHFSSPIIFPAIIFALGILIYANSLQGEFIWDDELLIRNNTAITSLKNIPQLFTGNIGEGASIEYPFYRPLFMLTLALDHALWGLATPGYHLTTVLIHVFVSLALFWFIKSLFDNRMLAFLTGLLFVVHPIHTEDVAYITGRADTLAVLFLLLSFIFYLKHRETGAIKHGLIFSLFFCAGLLCKETVVIFPGLLLAYHLVFKVKINKAGFFTVLAITSTYLYAWFFIFRTSLFEEKYSTTILERIPGFFAALTGYTRLLLHPFDLHMEYIDRLFVWSELVVIFGCLLTAFLFILAFKIRITYPLGTFSISWFFIALLPVSNIAYPASSYMAERYLYLPSMGYFLFLGGLATVLYRRERYRTASIVCVGALMSFYSILTINQNNYWRNPVVFYERTLTYSPKSGRIHNNLGTVYKELGQIEDARREYELALAIDPDYAEAYYNIGVLYADLKENDKAIEAYKKAIHTNPAYARSYYNLGDLLEEAGMLPEALASYQRALKYRLKDVRVYNKIGLLLKKAGRYDEAIKIFNNVLAKNPDSAESYNNLGIALKGQGKSEQALLAYKRAIDIKPSYGDAYYNLGSLLITLGRNTDAVNYLKDAIKFDPRHAKAYNNLAFAYKNLKDIDRAIKTFERLIELELASAKTHYNLALLYYHKKEYHLAVTYSDLAQERGEKVDPRFLELLRVYQNPRPTTK